MKVSICREYEFAAAHHLPLHEGKCRRPHGHNYVFEVELTGRLYDTGPSTGMVMDFYALDRLVDEYIISQLDHQDLNENKVLASYGYPTAENVALFIYETMKRELADTVTRVRVYETPRSFAEVTR